MVEGSLADYGAPVARFLVVDDDPVSNRVLQLRLKNRGYEIGSVASGKTCANIIEHAYRGQPDKPIELRLAIDETSLVLKIRDVGDVRFDPDEYESPDLSQPHEGGYGVFLMHSVMDEVLFDTTSERGTTLTLVKRR